MNHPANSVLFLLGSAACALSAESVVATLIDAPPAPPANVFTPWPSRVPEDCPYPKSAVVTGLSFTGRHAEYTGADTWYPSWAADGNLYSPWTDGNVNGLGSGSGGDGATTGHATILGDDPLKLTVADQGVFKSSPRPYEGRYPCGSLVHEGVWYYGTYCLHPSGGIRRDDGILYNWPWLGPFVGFRYSTDLGKTWTQTPCTPAKPLFGEHALKGEPVKIGAPHFVDFGKAMEHSPDGKAYLVAQGASDGQNRRFAYNSWVTADQAYLTRVTPGIENMNDASKYEFFAGHQADGEAGWTSDFTKIKPIAEWRDHAGCVTMTYNAPLRKYLMCVTDGGNTVSRYNTYILESDQVTGPWKLAAYLNHFGEQAYFVNIPSKFIGNDGRTLWLCYSANFSSGWGGTTFLSRPPGSRYTMCLQEVRLLAPTDPVLPPSPLTSSANIAPRAVLTVSSTHPDYSVGGLTDGMVDGFPGDIHREWCTAGERETATIRLTWPEAQAIDRIWLFDRPNDLDQVRSGLLVFSDGTTIKTGELPDNARQGLEVRFPTKRVKWLVFIADEVKPSTQNIGLAELAVFQDR
ncbi:MAG: hypothetical protein K9N23_01790 [Akkermansiaceae bacterium]|nr:hypothetical protein [Akkermansiaceae bacterium]MCF7730382.1 hypothetical protein [Akkermansiaceae bacterium]